MCIVNKLLIIVWVITPSLIFCQDLPMDLMNFPLIIETYNYDNFNEIRKNKYFNPYDSKNPQKQYKFLTESYKKIIEKCPIAYLTVEKDSILNFSKEEFPYILKLESRIVKESENVDNNDKPLGWSAEMYTYILDRRTNTIYSDMLGNYGKKMWKKLKFLTGTK